MRVLSSSTDVVVVAVAGSSLPAEARTWSGAATTRARVLLLRGMRTCWRTQHIEVENESARCILTALSAATVAAARDMLLVLIIVHRCSYLQRHYI